MSTRYGLFKRIENHCELFEFDISTLHRNLGISEAAWQEFLDKKGSAEGLFNFNQLRAIATFLGEPAFYSFIEQGHLRLTDFLKPSSNQSGLGCSTSLTLNKALRKIELDEAIPGGFPNELWIAPDSVKAIVVALYEQATEAELFSGFERLNWVADIEECSWGLLKQNPRLALPKQ